MNYVFLILGGNEGNRTINLSMARKAIIQQIGKIIQASSIYETAAWGNESLPPHLNQVLAVETTLTPQELLHQLLLIEKALGRTREVKWGSRIIDIDILFYNNLIINEKNLIIPHPQIPNRRFTLVPMAQIAPRFVHPVLLKTIESLLADTGDMLLVKKFL